MEASSSSSVSPLSLSGLDLSGPDTPSIPCEYPLPSVAENLEVFFVAQIILFVLFFANRRCQQDGLGSRRCSNTSSRRSGIGNATNDSMASGSGNEYGEVPDPQVTGQYLG